MDSIAQREGKVKEQEGRVARFCRSYALGSILQSACGYVKSKGIPVMQLMHYMLSLVFTGRTMYMELMSGEGAFAKDSVYRFLKSASTNWIKFTTELSAKALEKTVYCLTGEERRKVLIVDDTIYERGRSKKVELLSRVYDHARKRYTNGFRMLTIGWSDGNTFLPINGCLLSGKEPIQEATMPDRRTAGYRRRELAQMKAPTAMIELLKEAKAAQIQANHVLFDSWFCFPSVVMAVKELGYEVVAMVKRMPNVRYICDGKEQTIAEIYRGHKKRRGMSRYKLSVEVGIRNGDEIVPARIVYVVNRRKRKDYLAILCTDMSMTEDEILTTYAKRWDIEVFFKVCKTYLRLTGEWKTLSYDAMSAGVALVFVRYMLLAIEERNQIDDRTIGALFYACCDELPDISLAKAMQIMLHIMHDLLTDDFQMDREVIDQLMTKFLENLPTNIRNLLRMCA